MTPNLAKLHPYPFEKLNRLFADVTPVDRPNIRLSIGEPQHPAPAFVIQAVEDNLSLLSTYPTTKGILELRTAISDWLTRRFRLSADSLDPEKHVLPVNGTREALFAITQCIADSTNTQKDLVLSPNPFYQIYEGAAILAGKTPYFYDTDRDTQYRPDFRSIPDDIWARCELIYICSPGNPTGAVIPVEQLTYLIEKSLEHNFLIVADECYSEIYDDEDAPPPGLLQAAAEMGHHSYQNCLVFHSLSKRSNLPGLRSGFVAGDADVIAKFLLYRTYHGCSMPPHTQIASIAAWQDENHVIENRAKYRAKFAAVLEILQPVLDVQQPDAGFYLWPTLPVSGEAFARDLYQQYHVTTLPGAYLARDINGKNPGHNNIRMALVAEIEDCIDAAHHIRHLINAL